MIKTPKKLTIFRIMEAIEIKMGLLIDPNDPSEQEFNDIIWLNGVLAFENARPQEEFEETEENHEWFHRALKRCNR